MVEDSQTDIDEESSLVLFAIKPVAGEMGRHAIFKQIMRFHWST